MVAETDTVEADNLFNLIFVANINANDPNPITVTAGVQHFK